MRTVPASLHEEVLKFFYRKHARQGSGDGPTPSTQQRMVARIPALLKEHGFEGLCEKLQEKYSEHPAELWHASLRRAKVLYDFPENGHPMVGPLELQSGAIVLRAGDEVCITDTSRPARGWCLGYRTAVANPKIGTFPLAFTTAGGATSTKQSEKGNLKVRARKPHEADVLENAALGERAPVVARSVPSHWGPPESSTLSRRRGPKGCSGTPVPTHEQSALTPWRGEAWGENKNTRSASNRTNETIQPMVGSSQGLGGGEQCKPTRGGGPARAMAHHPRTDAHAQRVALVKKNSSERFAPKPPRFTAEQRRTGRLKYNEPPDEPGPDPDWADDLVVTVRYIPTLYVSTDTPNSVTLVADKTKRISDIKLMLQKELGVAANRIRLAHGKTGEALRDGMTLQDYDIHSDITLDGIWSFKDQTHNPQLVKGLTHTDERHQWSYARQGRHQPLQVARDHHRTRPGKSAALAVKEYEEGRQSAPSDGPTTYEGGWYSGSDAGRKAPHGFPGGYYGNQQQDQDDVEQTLQRQVAWTGAGAVGLRPNPAHFT